MFTFVGATRGHLCDGTAFLLTIGVSRPTISIIKLKIQCKCVTRVILHFVVDDDTKLTSIILRNRAYFTLCLDSVLAKNIRP